MFGNSQKTREKGKKKLIFPVMVIAFSLVSGTALAAGNTTPEISYSTNSGLVYGIYNANNQDVTSEQYFNNGDTAYVQAGTQVSLNGQTVDQSVYYTTDRTDPSTTVTGSTYTEPLTINNDTTVTANTYDGTEQSANEAINFRVGQPSIASSASSTTDSSSNGGGDSTDTAVATPVTTGTSDSTQTSVTSEVYGLSDINGHWAQASIEKLVSAGAIHGYPDGTFKPDTNITRAEFTAILVSALKLPENDGKMFNDTNGHWAQKAILTALSNGLVAGYNDTTFGANDYITREQMAAMIDRAAKFNVEDSGISYVDGNQVSDWAKAAVSTATAQKVMGGYPDNTFKPQGNATRAEAVSVIVRALNL